MINPNVSFREVVNIKSHKKQGCYSFSEKNIFRKTPPGGEGGVKLTPLSLFKVEDQFTNLCWLSFKKKSKSTLEHTKSAKISQVWFKLQSLTVHAPKFFSGSRFIFLSTGQWNTSGRFKKYITYSIQTDFFGEHFLTTKKFQKILEHDSGCTF